MCWGGALGAVAMIESSPLLEGRAVSLGTRAQHLERLRVERFDLVVVGGGITGAGIALDAASRGLKVALVEKNDFASGTSSRTTKLIHGGLRYLAQHWFRLTREALSERTLLQQLAPHLVEPIPFLFPIYNRRLEVWRVNTGLWLYDLMAGLRRTKVHKRLDRAETLRRVPHLKAEGLRASFVYYDARTDDTRFVVEVLKAAVAYGATVANYVEAERIPNEAGRAAGVLVRDVFTDESFQVHSSKVVVATGVWLDQILNADEEEPRRRVRPAKGVHLVVPRERLGGDTAVVFPTPDKRLMFVVPWQGATLIGTTDTDYSGPLDAPRADRSDVTYILDVVNAAFPGVELRDVDVISVMAGLRPLIESGATTTATVSREDRIFERPDGTIAIAGGKLTTYRRMGRKVVDLVVKRLREEGALTKNAKSRTRDVLIGGYPERLRRRFGRLARLTRFIRRRRRAGGIAPSSEPVSADTARRLWRTYGANWPAVVDLIEQDPSLGQRAVPDLDVLKAELVFAVRHEMAQTLLDALARRTHLAALDSHQVRGDARAVACLLAPDLGWDDAEIERQVQRYAADVEQFSMEPLLPARTGA
jgi:glycerol-3-phosphate dehydrogenase